MVLPPHLLEYADNLWRRFPEEFLALGAPGLEHTYDHSQATRCVDEDCEKKVVRVSMPRSGIPPGKCSFSYGAPDMPQCSFSGNPQNGFHGDFLQPLPTYRKSNLYTSTSQLSNGLDCRPPAMANSHSSEIDMSHASCLYPNESLHSEQEVPGNHSCDNLHVPSQQSGDSHCSNDYAVPWGSVGSKWRIHPRMPSKSISSSVSKTIPRHLIPRIDKLYKSISSGGFHERYDIEGEIGHGSFGIVYKARIKGTDRHRAVKEIDKSKINLEAMKNEINSALHLDHPHIIKLIRYYDESTSLYLIFELCTGPDLYDVIMDCMRSRQGCMSESDIAVALRHMLKALKCCHGQYMGHYDIKPENFMYRTPERKNLKMIDLGMSSGFTLKANALKGTCGYMAPELFRGIYGPEADVWSCGVVLFIMLTGRPLFPELDAKEMEPLVNNRQWVLERVKWASGQGISAEAYGLLRRMLLLDRHMRISVTEALEHPFVKSSYSQDLHDSTQQGEAVAVLEGLQESFRDLSAQPMLIRATLLLTAHLVAHNLDAMSSQRLAFRMLDKAGNGELSVDALEEALQFYNVSIPEDMGDLFNLVDTDRDGYISFMDFLSVTLPLSVRSDAANFHGAFKFFDTNCDGFIDASDLIDALGYKTMAEVETCHDAMREVCNGRPPPYRLSFKQFLHLFQFETSPVSTKRNRKYSSEFERLSFQAC